MSIDHKPDDDDELKRIQNAGGKVTAEGRVNGGLNLSRALGKYYIKGFLHCKGFALSQERQEFMLY
jgi:serine/threonine protein phosphatase PrpC